MTNAKVRSGVPLLHRRQGEGIGPPPTDDEIKNTMKFYELIDGMTALISPSFSLVQGEYAFISPTKAYEDRWKEACYLKEQDPLFGTYIGKREEFDADWESDEYWGEGTLHLKADEVEIINEV
ncbi:hypothetical protein LJC74_03800 [Eubacteriales bacterium OttesenSCG-928-A19]|nr:hypothetical protein [Eubacteriales bacterium OttesenSCG-928-A19]